jgi:hypothetical protein
VLRTVLKVPASAPAMKFCKIIKNQFIFTNSTLTKTNKNKNKTKIKIKIKIKYKIQKTKVGSLSKILYCILILLYYGKVIANRRKEVF